MLISSLTQDSGIHTMSSKKDSAFYDSSSFPYCNNAQVNTQLRKTNSDCLPPYNHYQLCSELDQLKVRSCEVLPRYFDSRNVTKDSDFFNYPNSSANKKHSCCEEMSGISHCSRNFQVPSDPGGGKYLSLFQY